MIPQVILKLFNKIKENALPLVLMLIALGLDLCIAFMGPYFHWPHWSAIVFPLVTVIPLTFSLFFLGGLLGAIATYVLFSFFIFEIILGFLTGSLSDDLICATATSGGFHHFKFQVFLWALIGLGLSFFLKRFFKQNLILSASFFVTTLGLIALNFPLSFYYSHFNLTVKLFPKMEVGVKHDTGEIVSLLSPNILSQFAYEIRHAFPGTVGDLMAMTAFGNDPGADTLPRPKHPFPKEIQPSDENAVQNIVLIMGESSTSTHYHAYGYPIETTPELDKILSKDNACKIQKVHSAANQTRDAVMPSVSLWTPQDLHEGMDQANLIEIANLQGYQTYWASVQSERGAYSGFIGYVAKYSNHFIDPETRDFTLHGERFSLKTEKDEALLPLFEAISSQKEAGQKKFIFLHLWGSHLPYGEKIRPEDEKALPRASHYDQSIHRTDRLLSRIVQTAKKNLVNPLIIYLPDHGEDPDDSAGHGLDFGGKDYQIPLILIGDQAKESCAYIEQLRAKNGWYSSNMNKFLLLRLLGMKANPDWIASQANPDTILHVTGQLYSWGKIPKQHLND